MIPDIQQFIASSCVTIQGCIQAIYNLIVALAVVIAFIMFFIGAFKNLLSVVPDIKMEGKRQMRNSIIGLIVIFSSGVLLYWINPEIFNARLIMFRVEITMPIIILESINEVNRILQSGQGKVLSFSNEQRCQDFFKAIDELVDAGVGYEKLYDLSKYQINGKNLTKNQVKILLKALLQTEGGGHKCDPTTWGRGDYAFATFGIEWGRAGAGTRAHDRSAYGKIVKEAYMVYKRLPEYIKNIINLKPEDFNVNEIHVGGKLDNPHLITAVAIKRLWGYEEHLKKMGLGSYKNDLIAILTRWKIGDVYSYIQGRDLHFSIANIITTIQQRG